MAKNVVVCCDGTWNTPTEMEHGLPCPTNVVKLYNALVRDGTQDAYYHPGVGTGKGWWDHIVGGGTGEGLEQNIMSAYRWLASSYSSGDRIFLFGFSRGAYTVRSLGGFVSRCGLLDLSKLKENPGELWKRVQEVFAAYRDGTDFPNAKKYPFHGTEPGKNPKEMTPIHFIGVWDTVGALGIPDDLTLLGLFDNSDKYRFHDTALSRIVVHARHAVALDEKRASFAPTLWTKVESSTEAKQIWFPGVHGDVGGGYLETGLSEGALEWMLNEAATCGLKVRGGVGEQLKADPLGILHDSCTGVFKFLKTKPRSAPLVTKDSHDLHPSATRRKANPPLAQGEYWNTTVLQAGDSRTFDIFAIQHWNATGLYLEAGATYEFIASGEWIDYKDKFSPAGRESFGFHSGDMVRYASSMLGSAENAFQKLTGRQADFWLTRRDEQAPWLALMGFIASEHGADHNTLANGETYLIGEKVEITPQASGYLYCFANDAWQTYGNNRGSVSLKVTRMPQLPSHRGSK
jgi:hypothetical protein